MHKRFLLKILLVVAGLLALSLLAGCGGDTKVEQPQAPDVAGMMNGSGDSLDVRIENLKKKEMTVEMITDGQSGGKWTQKDGSWRYDDPSDKTSYVIYNAQKKKTWVVNGNTAIESSGDSAQLYAGMNPAMMLGVYSMMPKTGGTDNNWEFSIPGVGKMTMEMNGPDGLPSKMSSEDASTGKTTVTEFVFTNVGNIPSSTFDLPSNVTVTQSGSGTSTGMMPGGTSTSMMPSGY